MSAPSKTDDDGLCVCIRSLWALIEALRAGAGDQAEAAIDRAVAAVTAARAGDNYLLLHEVDGALHVSGRRLPLNADVFQPAQELVRMLREHDIGEVLFDASIDHAAMQAWAQGWVDGDAVNDPALGRGIHTRERAGALAVAANGTGDIGGPESQLGSVFLQHHLVRVLAQTAATPPHLGKVTVAAVVDRMLQLRAGLEPLTLLQSDAQALQRGLHVAVYATILGRVFGWPEERLTDLGAAALLHDIGALVAPSRPAQAGFAWLLARGSDPFWLRCAVVARNWRERHGRSLADLDVDSSLSAAVVRLAVAIHDQVTAGADAGALAAALRQQSEHGDFPAELVQPAAETMRQLLQPS